MEDKYGVLIEVASRQIKQAFQRKLNEEGFDITVDQWVVLDRLSAGPLSQVEVAEALYKDAPTLTRIVDLLCQKGLTRRELDPLDRRKFRVGLTLEGEKMYRRVSPVISQFRNDGWEGLSKDDYQHLHRIISTVLRNFKIDSAESISLNTALAGGKAA